MNFSTECLAHLQIFRKALQIDGLQQDVFAMDTTIRDLEQSTKFLIPSPGHMNVIATKAALKFMRLPYPICAFEYTCPEARADGIKGSTGFSTGKSSRRIALAYDCTKDVGPIPLLKAAGVLPKDANGILVQSLYYVDQFDMWAASFCAGYLDEDAIGDNDFRLDNTQLKFNIDACPLMIESLMEHFGHLNREQRTLVMLNDVADEVGMAVRACLLLNTRNLKVVKAIEAPVALNKKRAKSGKPPFFEYHTLDIFVSNTGSRLARKRVDQNFVRQHFANMNLQRKWGTVIGHFKMRATGMFFWNAHTRGNKEAGVVQKEYQVKKGD